MSILNLLFKRVSASAVFLLFLSSCSENIDEYSSIVKLPDQERWLTELCSSKYKGRRAGTEGCDSVSVYLSKELSDMGYEVFFQDFRYKDSLNLKNLFVKYSGLSDSLIVVGAHYDGAVYGENFPAADDNGSGVVAVLSICKALSEKQTLLNKSVVLAFWAAEEVTLNSPFNGSRYFINHFDEKNKITHYCNIDCFARKEQGVYFYYAPGEDSLGIMMNSLVDKREDTHFDIVVKENEKSNSDYVPFSQSGYPYFGWNDFDTSGHIHSPRDRMEGISIEKINGVVDLTVSFLGLL